MQFFKTIICSNTVELYVLAMLILFASCEYRNIVCKTDPDLNEANCIRNKTFTSDYLPTLPIDTIPIGVKSIIFVNTYFESYSNLWQINDHRMFHAFENLTKLYLSGPVNFSKTYYEEPMKSNLIDELFQIPRLTVLTLHEWEPYRWKFSATLKVLNLMKFDRTYFDLDMYPNLISVHFAESKLKKFTPPIALQELILTNNRDIKVNVYDIVGLCQLKNLTINLFNENFEKMEKYCECKRLQAYVTKFKIKTRGIRCDNIQADCKDYSLEKSIRIHKKKCSLDDDSSDSITLASESRLHEVALLASFFVILTSILFFFIISVILP